MKKTLLAALTALPLFFGACSKQNEQVLIRFQNTLSTDISEARIEFNETNQTEIGQIPANQTTGYIQFDYFEVGDGFPMGVLHGKKDGEAFSAWSGLWCGTGVDFKQLAPGSYTIEISKVGIDSVFAYQIRFVD